MWKNYFILLILLFVLVVPISFGALSDGLISNYKMNSAGNSNDTFNRQNLTQQGTVGVGSGKIGGARGQFSNSNWLNSTPLDYNCSQTYTFNYWVNMTSLGGQVPVMLLGDNAVSGQCGIFLQVNGGQIMIYSFRQSGNSCQSQYAYSGFENQYKMITSGLNTTHCWISTDGVSKVNTSWTAQPSAVKANIMNYGVSLDRSAVLAGFIDEFSIWNRTLSTSEVQSLYNAGVGVEFNLSTAGVNPIVINNLTLTLNGSSLGTFFNSTDNVFYLNANISVDGFYVNLSNKVSCNFSANNISLELNNFNSSNATVSDVLSYSVLFNQSNLSVLSERVTFNVCKNLAPINTLGIFLDDVNYKNLTGVIPLCSVAYHQEVFIPTVFKSSTNFTLKCLDCSPVQSFTLVNLDINGGSFRSVIDYDRIYFNLSRSLVFNSSNGLHQFNSNLLGFDILGNQAIRVVCNASDSNNITSSFNYVLGGFPPVTKILQIGNISPINNLTFPYYVFEDEDLFIVAESSGGIIINSNITVFNSSGGYYLITGESGTVPYTFFNKDANYTIVARAHNNNGSSSDSIIITVKDTQNPVISWIFPQSDNSSYTLLNAQARVQAVFTDNNLWGVNLSCISTGMGGTEVLSFFRTGLTGTTFFLDNFTIPITVIGDNSFVCSVEVCDSHTLEEWVAEDVSIDKSKRELMIDDEVMLKDSSNYDIDSIQFTQLKDRLSYCYSYIFLEDKFKSNLVLHYNINKSAGWKMVSKDSYANWDLKQWLDFKSDNFVVENVVESSDEFVINGRILNPSEKLCFQSIGGLNCKFSVVSADVLISAPVTGNNATSVNINNIGVGTSVYLGFLGFFWIILLIACSFNKNLLIGLVAVLLGFWFGLSIWGFSSMIGIGTLVFNSLIFISLMFNSRL